MIAIKFIHKGHAFTRGRLKPKQLDDEIKLHSFLGVHRNIIQFYSHGSNDMWVWIAMELAGNGDLFDKIGERLNARMLSLAMDCSTQAAATCRSLGK